MVGVSRIGKEIDILLTGLLFVYIPDDRVEERLEGRGNRALVSGSHGCSFDFWASLGALRCGGGG